MKIGIIILWFSPVFHAFLKINFLKKTPLPIQHYYNKSELLCNNYKKEKEPSENLLQIINKKRIGFLKIIRYKNILPTFFLCFSGGWIMSPSWLDIWTNVSFLVTTIITILIMSSSMIINDLFDLDIDTFNMSRRPLVTGEVTKWEAVLYIFFLVSFSEFLNIHFLSSFLQDNVHFSIISLMLYTPIFKKIMLIKNIFCAYFVAFSIFLGGNASCKQIISMHPNFNLFSILLSLTFFGSFYNEVLLDIRDVDGDKFYNVKTIPGVIGKENAWIMAGLVLFYSIIGNTFSLMYLKGYDTGLILPFIFVPTLKTFYSIPKNNFSKESIIDAVNSSSGNTFAMIFLFFYLLAL
jgi:4-hydroxybenzoate polyprenyltransferase